MDPITSAITAAIAAGVLSSTGEVAKQAIVDLYTGLKDIIKQKFGKESDVIKAIDELEKKPESSGRKETLQEEVSASKADKDLEITKVAQALLDQLNSEPGVMQHAQTAIGTNIVQADRGSNASINITQPEKKNK